MSKANSLRRFSCSKRSASATTEAASRPVAVSDNWRLVCTSDVKEAFNKVDSELTRVIPTLESLLLSLLLTDWTEALALCSEVFPSALSDWLWAEESVWLTDSDLEANEADKEAESEALNDKDVDLEANSEADTDWLSDKDSLKEASEVCLDAVSDDSWLFTWLSWTLDTDSIFPRTTESDAAKRSVLAPASLSKIGWSVISSAWATWVATEPPSKAPVASTPLSTVWPEKAGASTSTCWAATDGASTPPLSTLKRPKFDVAARSQCFPDLTNLNRVTRSVSRYWPSFLLKNIYTPFIFWLKHSFQFYHKIKQKISFQDCFLAINPFIHFPKNTIIMLTLRLIKTICIFRISN